MQAQTVFSFAIVVASILWLWWLYRGDQPIQSKFTNGAEIPAHDRARQASDDEPHYEFECTLVNPQSGSALLTSCVLDFKTPNTFVSPSIAVALGLQKVEGGYDVDIELDYDIYSATIAIPNEGKYPVVLGQQVITDLGLVCDAASGTCSVNLEGLYARSNSTQAGQYSTEDGWGEFDDYGVDPYADGYTGPYSAWSSSQGGGGREGCGCEGGGGLEREEWGGVGLDGQQMHQEWQGGGVGGEGEAVLQWRGQQQVSDDWPDGGEVEEVEL